MNPKKPPPKPPFSTRQAKRTPQQLQIPPVGRDDKGRAATFRKPGDMDGQTHTANRNGCFRSLRRVVIRKSVHPSRDFPESNRPPLVIPTEA